MGAFFTSLHHYQQLSWDAAADGGRDSCLERMAASGALRQAERRATLHLPELAEGGLLARERRYLRPWAVIPAPVACPTCGARPGEPCREDVRPAWLDEVRDGVRFHAERTIRAVEPALGDVWAWRLIRLCLGCLGAKVRGIRVCEGCTLVFRPKRKGTAHRCSLCEKRTPAPALGTFLADWSGTGGRIGIPVTIGGADRGIRVVTGVRTVTLRICPECGEVTDHVHDTCRKRIARRL